jgi:hypothetical protein
MNLIDILNKIGYVKLHDFGRQLSTRPLYRDSDNDLALTINKDTGEWYDFVERVGGPLESLIEKTLGTTLTPELKQSLESESFLPDRRTEVEVNHPRTFDKASLARLIPDKTYWNKRGVSSTTLEALGGGVAVNGRMMNRYVFPILNERDELVGFSGRYIYKSDYVAKWKHIGKKSAWVYPLIHTKEIFNSRQVILVESIGDMLALKDTGIHNVLVTFGVKVSSTLKTLILKMDCDDIILAFNNDRLNKQVGNKAAQDAKWEFLNYFDENQVRMALPDQKNDFGEMTREEILLWKQKLS